MAIIDPGSSGPIELKKLPTTDTQSNLNTFKENDLMKGFGLSDTQASGVDINKAKPYLMDFAKTIDQNQSNMETQEFKNTGLFSKNFQNQFRDYLTKQKITQNDNQIFGNNKGIVDVTNGSAVTGNINTQTGGTITGTNGITSATDWNNLYSNAGINLNQSTINSLNQNTEEGNKAVKDYLNSYATGSGQYTQEKGYYSNFDTVNTQRNNILNDVTSLMSQKKGQLTDQEYQNIANKYGLSIDQVKNPNSLYNNLQLTEEGKRIKGVTGQEQNIAQMQTNFDRQKADLQTNLDNNLTDINNKIEDVQRQVKQNEDWMTASGAWSGAGRSSGYQQGIQNVKDEGARTVARLKDMASRLQNAKDTDVARLTEDFNKAYTTATQDLKDQTNKLNQTIGIELTGLTETYGMGSKEMGKKLDEIANTYNLKSQELIGGYLNNIAKYQSIINDSIDTKNKILEQETKLADRRYNEYTANNGALLGNTNLQTLMGEYQDGKLSAQRVLDLQNTMVNSIVGNLSKLGQVSNDDINSINHMLEQGLTPLQIISQFNALDKFKPKMEVDKTIDLGDRTRIYYSNGQYEDIKKGGEYKFTEFNGNLYRQDSQGGLSLAVQGAEKNKYTKLDDGMYQDSQGNILTKEDINTQKILSNSYLNAEIGQTGGDCGFFASRSVGMSSTPGGNNLEARIKAFSDTSAVPGGMVLFNGGGYDKTYGHIATVTGVNPENGTIDIIESNYNGDKKVTKRTISADDPAISGFYNNTPLTGGEKSGISPRSTYTDNDIALLGSVTKLDKQGKETLKDNGFTEQDWANFNAGLLPPTNKQKVEAKTIVDKVDDILAGDWSDAVGLMKSRIFTGGGTDRKVTEIKVDALKDLLAMANLDKMKGAMSDKDIEFLRNTATYLSTDLSETDFEKTLNDIKNKYNTIQQGNKSTTESTNSAQGKSGTTYTW